MPTMWQPRIPTKFTNDAGTETFTFPLAEYSFEQETKLIAPEAKLTGGHGGLDLLSAGLPVKESGTLALSFTVFDDTPEAVEATIDGMLDKLFRFGRGKLWTQGREGTEPSITDTLRWTRARAVEMPKLSWAGGMVVSKRAICGFRHEPFWYDETALSATPVSITTSPQTVVIDNTGNARIYNAILTVYGTAAGGVTILNATNGYQVKSTRALTGSATRLRFDAGKPAVDYSADSGSTWTGDYANFVRKAGQVQFMVLEPGENSLQITGLSGSFVLGAYPANH